ncbi:hypothetical protein F5Y14DRAFT_389979 [Nemania sp. NC0429]|nr:hypothetical protein F5Y14DRAFT_389979 [Nemania sp. NC0429]
MLQYFTHKKTKKHPEEEAVADKPEKDESKEEELKQGSSEITKGEGSAGAETKAKSSSGTPIPQIISQPANDDDDDAAPEGTPVLDHDDEKFLEHLTASHSSLGATDGENRDEPPPPLPPRVKTPVVDIDSDTSSVLSREVGKDEDAEHKGKGKEKGREHDGEEERGKEEGKEKGKEKATKTSDRFKRFTFATNFPRNISFRRKPATTASQSASDESASTSALEPNTLTVPEAPGAAAASHETSDLARVLDDLNLSARNNRAFSLSTESAAMVRRFTQVLKDLTNGVPTAYGDLVALLEDRDGLLARNYEKLPSGLKRLVAQLPEKLTTSLAPELLAAAAEAQGLRTAATVAEYEEAEAAAAAAGGLKAAAKTYLSPANLHDLVTKPGAIAGLLRGIVNALKTRFPAFVGTNVLWSLAVFLLLSMLWYCYKRGREVRLEQEAAEAAAAAAAEEGEKGEKESADPEKAADGRVDGGIEGPRVEELPDDPMLPAPVPAPAPAPAPEAVRDGEGESGSKS